MCALRELTAATTILRIAPAPWLARQCSTSGMVFLENPPRNASLDRDGLVSEAGDPDAANVRFILFGCALATVY